MDDRVKGKAERIADSPSPRSRGDEGVFRALSSPGPVEDAAVLSEIRSRIRRSIDDPRPSLSLDRVDDVIDALVAKARSDGGRD